MNRLRSLPPLLCTLASACATYGIPMNEVAHEINATLYTGPTLVEPGDVLNLRFARKADWNLIAPVRSDGCVSFPAIGEVRAAGRSVVELERILSDKYQPILTGAPDLTINLGDAAAASQPQGGITVGGEVRTPGLVGMAGERLTLLEALGRAGGHLKGTALLGNTLMLRRSPQSGLYTSWRIDARETHWDMCQPIYLQRHDMILVPNTPIDNVNIWVDQYINKMIPTGLTGFAVGIIVGTY